MLIVLYYMAIIELCDACGEVNKHKGPHDDLQSEFPSPYSRTVLEDYNRNDMRVLGYKIENDKKKRGKIGHIVKELSELVGLYPEGTNLKDDKNTEIFCDQLMWTKKEGDFRDYVRNTCEKELKKIAEGKNPEPMNFADFVEQYNILVEKRELKKKKK